MSASAILRLQAAGFSTEQVTALADLIDSQAASKADLLEVEHRIEMKLEYGVGAMKADLLEVEHRIEMKLEHGVGGVKADLLDVEHRIEMKLEHDVGAVKADVLLLKWMIGFVLAFQAAFFFKMFMH